MIVYLQTPSCRQREDPKRYYDSRVKNYYLYTCSNEHKVGLEARTDRLTDLIAG